MTSSFWKGEFESTRLGVEDGRRPKNQGLPLSGIEGRRETGVLFLDMSGIIVAITINDYLIIVQMII